MQILTSCSSCQYAKSSTRSIPLVGTPKFTTEQIFLALRTLHLQCCNRFPQTVTYTLPLTASTAQDIRCAIWWPEASYFHNSFRLDITIPNGGGTISSLAPNSVWQRVALSNIHSTGTYTISISSLTPITNSPQPVHLWCFH